MVVTKPTLSVLLHNQTFNVKSPSIFNGAGKDKEDQLTTTPVNDLNQLEYTSLDINIAPIVITNVMALAEFIGFFFASYSDEETAQQKAFKEKSKPTVEAAPTTTSAPTLVPDSLPRGISDLFDRWKKNSPFNLNITITNSVILFPSDSLDVFVEIPLLDVSNRCVYHPSEPNFIRQCFPVQNELVKFDDFFTDRFLFDELVILLKNVGAGVADAKVDWSIQDASSVRKVFSFCYESNFFRRIYCNLNYA